jgi:nucleotide-binding universal stress UspA family protein
MHTPRKFLVPTDFSEGSRAALAMALELARPLGASLTLVHVYQIPFYPLPDGGAIIAPPETAAAIVGQAEAELRRTAREAQRGNDLVIDARTVEGVPFSQIVRLAEEGRYDLVVMGTHGRTGLGHLLLGSVAEKVVRASHIPVLTVHGQASENAVAQAS